MREAVAQFGPGRALTGIVTRPQRPTRNDALLPAVVFLDAGLIHRVGPNRLYVRLARELSAAGLLSLRFDYSGLGDSRSTDDPRPAADRMVSEIRAAMDYLASSHGARTFILAGICSAAVLSYLTGREDRRVGEVWMINPPAPVLSRRYLRILRSHPNRWRRLVQSIGHRLKRRPPVTPRGESPPPEQVVHGLASLVRGGVNVVIVSSEWDAGFDYLTGVLPTEMAAQGIEAGIEFISIEGADHLFHLVENQDLLVERLRSHADAMIVRRSGGLFGPRFRSDEDPEVPRPEGGEVGITASAGGL
jgi:hypothetical protein